MTDWFSNAGAWAPWLVFAVLVGGMLAIDLGVAHRKAHTPTRREAVTWTVVWVARPPRSTFLTMGARVGSANPCSACQLASAASRCRKVLSACLGAYAAMYRATESLVAGNSPFHSCSKWRMHAA